MPSIAPSFLRPRKFVTARVDAGDGAGKTGLAQREADGCADQSGPDDRDGVHLEDEVLFEEPQRTLLCRARGDRVERLRIDTAIESVTRILIDEDRHLRMRVADRIDLRFRNVRIVCAEVQP